VHNCWVSINPELQESARIVPAAKIQIAIEALRRHFLTRLGSGRSVARLARVFRVHEVVSSNLTAPTIFSERIHRFSDYSVKFLPSDYSQSMGYLGSACIGISRQALPARQRRRSSRGAGGCEWESGPACKDLLGLCNLLRQTGEIEFQFSRPSGDLNLDRIQMLILHSQAELFLSFMDPVLLEAITHDRRSTGYGHKATANSANFFILGHCRCKTKSGKCRDSKNGAERRTSSGTELSQGARSSSSRLQ
jgi:hypothetical protein